MLFCNDAGKLARTRARAEREYRNTRGERPHNRDACLRRRFRPDGRQLRSPYSLGHSSCPCGKLAVAECPARDLPLRASSGFDSRGNSGSLDITPRPPSPDVRRAAPRGSRAATQPRAWRPRRGNRTHGQETWSITERNRGGTAVSPGRILRSACSAVPVSRRPTLR